MRATSRKVKENNNAEYKFNKQRFECVGHKIRTHHCNVENG